MKRHTPLGYRIVNGKADIVPEAAQIVKAVFQAYLGGTSTYQIAKDLTKQGVLNASHKPSWNHGSVGKILENRKYTGDEFYPSLIESGIFEQVQKRRQETVKSLGRHVQPNSFRNQTKFSGTLYCGICGQSYRRYVEHCNQPSENVKWKCKHYIKSNRVSCLNIFLTDEQIESAFMNVINQIIATPAKILIAYFTAAENSGVDAISSASYTNVNGTPVGRVRAVADWIAEETGGELFSIQTSVVYPTDGGKLIDYAAEEQDEKARPELTSQIENLDQYDTIFIGYPTWWYDMPMVMYSFFEEYDFTGKTIIPFNVHNGSRFSGTIETIQELEPEATVVEDGFTVSERTVADAAGDIASWLDELGY